MEKFKSLLNKVLKKPEEKLAILNRIILVAGCLLSLYGGLKTMFFGRTVMIYEPFYGLVYNKQRSFLGGLCIIVLGVLGTYIFSLFLESFLQLIRNTRRENCQCDEKSAAEKGAEAVVENEELKESMVKYYKLIPGVGQKLAEKLYDKFGANLGDAIRTREEEFDEIKGLNDKTKEEIYNFFYGEENN